MGLRARAEEGTRSHRGLWSPEEVIELLDEIDRLRSDRSWRLAATYSLISDMQGEIDRLTAALKKTQKQLDVAYVEMQFLEDKIGGYG